MKDRYFDFDDCYNQAGSRRLQSRIARKEDSGKNQDNKRVREILLEQVGTNTHRRKWSDRH